MGDNRAMRLRFYHYGELIGIVLLLGSTATQIFYLEPLDREISWRLVAFSTQQNAQVQVRTAYDNQLSLLRLMNAPADTVKDTEAKRDAAISKFETADANIANYMLSKERVEGYLDIIVMALFALGSLLAGVGRALEMHANPERR
jgi:hypothetical protein